ncbi:MAG: hypothetical protein OQL06_02375, partial [Gammaproteobacteria bacterium]|nr:hypothetical protein [Gammaproteobacteria bacterium]
QALRVPSLFTILAAAAQLVNHKQHDSLKHARRTPPLKLFSPQLVMWGNVSGFKSVPLLLLNFILSFAQMGKRLKTGLIKIPSVFRFSIFLFSLLNLFPL